MQLWKLTALIKHRGKDDSDTIDVGQLSQNFLLSYSNYMCFTPMHLVHFQEVVVLQWSPDSGACPYIRIKNHKCIWIAADVKTEMNPSTRLRSYLVPAMTDLEATLRVSQDPPFEKARIDEYDKFPILAWKVALIVEHALNTIVVVTEVHDEWLVKITSCNIENCSTNEENVIGTEVRFAVMEMVTNELLTMAG